MRVLDCNDEACRRVAEGAPKIVDRLCEPCRTHFGEVLEGLRATGIQCTVVPTLVRGLDYYTRTAFEVVSPALSASQGTVVGGGRYDGLAEVLGGPPVPGVGFGSGIERIALALQEEASDVEPVGGLECFVVSVGEGTADYARDVAAALRRRLRSVDMAFDTRPLKAQLRMADRLGARFAAIAGRAEAEGGTITVRRLADGEQREGLALEDAAAWMSEADGE
jgi:histidyl-tRNA synthetase